MKYKKIICILFAALFIVTAASGAVARQETRSLKISDIFKSRMSRSEGMSIGEGPLARLLYSLLERFHSN